MKKIENHNCLDKLKKLVTCSVLTTFFVSPCEAVYTFYFTVTNGQNT